MILYHYERHHFEFMQECLDANITSPSKVRNTWPFTDMIPTAGSLNRRLVSLAEYGIEKCVKGLVGGHTSRELWTEEEENDLILAFELSEKSQKAGIDLFLETHKNRNAIGAMIRIQLLAANGRIVLPNATGIKQDYKERFLSRGLNIIGSSKGNEKTYFDYECTDFGHKGKARADVVQGCKMCAEAGSMSLTELKNSPLGLIPCKVYFIQFDEDGVLKTGRTIKSISERGTSWPSFKLIKEIDTTLFHARRIETYTHNSCPRIPLYEPLIGNGGTECFEEKYYNKILDILNSEEKNESR